MNWAISRSIHVMHWVKKKGKKECKIPKYNKIAEKRVEEILQTRINSRQNKDKHYK